MGTRRTILCIPGGWESSNKPAFRYAIRNSRCLVIADAFYEGPEKEKLSKPYLVYLRERRPFAFAGIFSHWTHKETGEEWKTFAIITTVANELMQKLGHHRSPVILPEGMERRWISNLALSEVTPHLRPYDYRLMNAYPVSPEVKSVKNNSKELVQPTGERLFPEYNVKITNKLKLEGMGRKRK